MIISAHFLQSYDWLNRLDFEHLFLSLSALKIRLKRHLRCLPKFSSIFCDVNHRSPFFEFLVLIYESPVTHKGFLIHFTNHWPNLLSFVCHFIQVYST